MKQTITFPNGRKVLNLGQGTWGMGEEESRRRNEVEALRTGIDNGLTLIDSAEMYAEGNAERVAGEAITPYNREELFLVSKVYPTNAGEKRMFESCENSLKRLGVNELDLYLLHWPGNIALQETIDCFEELKQQGKIRDWGVSNFDLEDMQELLSLRNGENCQTNQVLYHLASRGIEVVLYDYLRANNIPVMAYCPIIGQEPDLKEKVYESPAVNQIAKHHNISVIQLLLAFVTQYEQMIAIPKAGSKDHVIQNRQALNIELTNDEMAMLNEAFPAPEKRIPLRVQ
ncbi:MAG: aldo/keto reductase [Alkalibacterium sp.]|nr:aldo/keto reductase [Alkalibacterium sp.]